MVALVSEKDDSSNEVATMRGTSEDSSLQKKPSRVCLPLPYMKCEKKLIEYSIVCFYEFYLLAASRNGESNKI